MDALLKRSNELSRREFINRSARTFLGVGLLGSSSHALAELNPDEARKMADIGRSAVREKYNWEKEEETLVALYNDLLSGSDKT